MSQGVHSYLLWGERREDDITKLPDEWEARVADDNRIYFVKWVHTLLHHRKSQIYINFYHSYGGKLGHTKSITRFSDRAATNIDPGGRNKKFH